MEWKLKILLCQNDENLGVLLAEYLRAKRYDTVLYTDGESAFRAFARERFDLCILDVVMQKKDGITLAGDIRVVNPEVPVIFLTANNMSNDIAGAFEAGADDYMTKPFSLEELVLRIEAVLRRIKVFRARERPVYRFGNTVFDTQKQMLTVNGKSTKLTTKEGELLTLLCSHANNLLERGYALTRVWDADNYFQARCMDVYITKLRKLLRADPAIQIVNIHGKGYKLLATEKPANSD